MHPGKGPHGCIQWPRGRVLHPFPDVGRPMVWPYREPGAVPGSHQWPHLGAVNMVNLVNTVNVGYSRIDYRAPAPLGGKFRLEDSTIS